MTQEDCTKAIEARNDGASSGGQVTTKEGAKEMFLGLATYDEVADTVVTAAIKGELSWDQCREILDDIEEERRSGDPEEFWVRRQAERIQRRLEKEAK